jgi:L-serine/L-threonine ammonia-lyase
MHDSNLTSNSLAAVTAAKALGQECAVIVPESAAEFMKNKIRIAGGEVYTRGASWQEADDYARELLSKDPTGVYCPPFDHPDIWDGHSTMIEEIVEDLGAAPDGLIVSVGGGGLFAGLMLGLERNEMQDVPIIAVETKGADSLNRSLKEGRLIALPKITSIATSLGARKVAQKAFDLGQRGNVISHVLTDGQAATACVKFLDDERLCIEVACGVSIAVLYEGLLPKLLPDLSENSKVVIIVCGGKEKQLAFMIIWLICTIR